MIEEQTQVIEKRFAVVTCYPDKINIETYHKVKAGYNISAANVTILGVALPNDELGRITKHHLSLTQYGIDDPKPTDFSTYSEGLFEIARI